LQAMLHEYLGDHPAVGDIRGRGFFWGIELVQDKRSKAPFDPKHKLHARIKKAAFARGLCCYPMGGTVDGIQGDHVLLAPPFISTHTDLESIARLLRASLDDVMADLPMARVAAVTV
jgi:adenosylmethionine-8-amino-7-oxononanoate aminotransferase